MNSENRVPKIIHYCWFGKTSFTKKISDRIADWKIKMPDYYFVEWNEDSFPINKSIGFVKEAYSAKKWAFVSDYVRLYALNTYGGIYLDTDVDIIKSFDDFLKLDGFISFESKQTLCTAVIGARKGNALIEELLHEYEQLKFNMTPNSEMIFQHIFNDEDTNIHLRYDRDHISIFPIDYFCGKDYRTYKIIKTKNTVAIHQLDATWYPTWKKIFKVAKKVVRKIVNKMDG